MNNSPSSYPKTEPLEHAGVRAGFALFCPRIDGLLRV